MDDAHRTLEKKALRNVRALFERLERDDRLQGRRQWPLLLIALAALLSVGFIVVSVKGSPPSTQAMSCELEAWNASAADFERKTRQAHPQLSYPEIQVQLERERPFLMAMARIDCSAKSK